MSRKLSIPPDALARQEMLQRVSRDTSADIDSSGSSGKTPESNLRERHETPNQSDRVSAKDR